MIHSDAVQSEILTAAHYCTSIDWYCSHKRHTRFMGSKPQQKSDINLQNFDPSHFSATFKGNIVLWLIMDTGGICHAIVTWRLKVGIVEQEETSTARQRLGKQVSAAMDTQVIIENLLGMMFSIQSVHSG
jgi:hypothetical protein